MDKILASFVESGLQMELGRVEKLDTELEPSSNEIEPDFSDKGVEGGSNPPLVPTLRAIGRTTW